MCDKNCEKIHKISKNIYCCGAGTAADTENVTGLIQSQLELHRLATGSEPRVGTACQRLKQHLFGYQGHVSAALVLGGIDCEGAHVYTVWPHGSTDRLPYATMGSGSLAAMAVFEAGYKDDMTEKEAVDLVDAAIQAGIFNDLGSGSNVDVCVIDKDSGMTMYRGYKTDLNKRTYEREAGYEFKKGTTGTYDPVHSPSLFSPPACLSCFPPVILCCSLCVLFCCSVFNLFLGFLLLVSVLPLVFLLFLHRSLDQRDEDPLQDQDRRGGRKISDDVMMGLCY